MKNMKKEYIGGTTLLSRQDKGFDGIFWEKLLRYYDTKAVRSNRKVGRYYYADRKVYRRVSKPDLQENMAQNDKNIIPRPLGRGCHEVTGEGLSDKNVSKAHRKRLVPYCLSNLVSSQKAAFTLAEILITLGIIGVVAALTIPTISRNIQHAVLKNQFKKFYSTFWQAVIGTQTKLGRPLKCYYWSDGYPGNCSAVCSGYNEYGNCTGWKCDNGESLPSDYNGPMTECSFFTEEVFLNTLRTTKICKNNAYEQGCLPKDFRGADMAKKEENPDVEYDPNYIFADSPIKNRYPVFVLADGTYVIGYARYPMTMPVFVADINGSKGPNKWGYDIFGFRIEGDSKNGITRLYEQNYAIEKGGKTFQQMYNEAFNINAQ